MIVFAAIVPHSPLLIPSIGKDKLEALSKTTAALKEIEEALYLSKAETIVMISPHAQAYPDAFSANMAPKYRGSLKEFGDHETTIEAKGDFMVLDHVQRELRGANIPFTLTSEENLDYGITIPLLLLTKQMKDWKLIPLAPSLLDTQAHLDFGRGLKEVLHREETRIAFIASADLSHKLTADSPGGASIEGPAFDATIQTKVKSMDVQGLLALDPQAIEAAGQCGYRPVMTLLGLLGEINVTPQVLSYEAPFGVGYLTVKFDFA